MAASKKMQPRRRRAPREDAPKRPVDVVREARATVQELHQGTEELLAEVAGLMEDAREAAAFGKKAVTFFGAVASAVQKARKP